MATIDDAAVACTVSIEWTNAHGVTTKKVNKKLDNKLIFYTFS